jgi:hypothetical protein
MRLLVTIWMFMTTMLLYAQHPVSFFTRAEAAEVKKNLHKYPLLTQKNAGRYF